MLLKLSLKINFFMKNEGVCSKEDLHNDVNQWIAALSENLTQSDSYVPKVSFNCSNGNVTETVLTKIKVSISGQGQDMHEYP